MTYLVWKASVFYTYAHSRKRNFGRVYEGYIRERCLRAFVEDGVRGLDVGGICESCPC